MPDMVVQHVEGLLVERIKSLAKERQCSVNDVLLNALRNGLGLSAAQEFSESLRDPQALTVLSGHWDSEEKMVFQEALQALAKTRPTQLAPESIRSDDTNDFDE
ncbi:hypothetical protein [Rhodanobacter sp. L36]|uniref:hypothetical protein n=1 Tax=Rhodanobacter sp. L36 TaxID=1747221 RepID=UPI00131DBA9B|nr:hypothetical protein [Rhodanobacter sp. L36]